MAISHIADLIRDSQVIEQYNQAGFLSYGQYDRSFFVTGLDTTDPTTIQSQAKNYIQGQVPLGTVHPNNSLCKARYYQVKPLEAHDKVEVVVSYVYTDIPIDSTQWTIESNTYQEIQEIDMEYDDTVNPTKLQPIVVDNYILRWTHRDVSPPTGATGVPETPAYGQVQAYRPRKRWIYTKTIYSTVKAIALDNAGLTYQSTVNKTLFNGCKPYTVLCTAVNVTYRPYAGSNLGQLEFIYRPEGWLPWARFSNTQLGVPPNLWRGALPGFTIDDPTGPGGIDISAQANGTTEVNAYLATELNDLVNLI